MNSMSLLDSSSIPPLMSFENLARVVGTLRNGARAVGALGERKDGRVGVLRFIKYGPIIFQYFVEEVSWNLTSFSKLLR